MRHLTAVSELDAASMNTATTREDEAAKRSLRCRNNRPFNLAAAEVHESILLNTTTEKSLTRDTTLRN